MPKYNTFTYNTMRYSQYHTEGESVIYILTDGTRTLLLVYPDPLELSYLSARVNPYECILYVDE